MDDKEKLALLTEVVKTFADRGRWKQKDAHEKSCFYYEYVWTSGNNPMYLADEYLAMIGEEINAEA